MGAALHAATQRQFGDLWSPPGDLILLLFLWGHSRVIILNKNKVILILKTVRISFPIPYKSLGTRGQSIIVLTLVVEAAVEVSNWNRGTEMLLGEDDAYRVWEINKGSHKGKPTVAWWNRLLLLTATPFCKVCCDGENIPQLCWWWCPILSQILLGVEAGRVWWPWLCTLPVTRCVLVFWWEWRGSWNHAAEVLYLHAYIIHDTLPYHGHALVFWPSEIGTLVLYPEVSLTSGDISNKFLCCIFLYCCLCLLEKLSVARSKLFSVISNGPHSCGPLLCRCPHIPVH